jgi:hypothetical protein
MLKAHRTRANARKHHAHRAVTNSAGARWMSVMGRRKNKLVAWHFPALGGRVQHSLSPIVADGGAVMKPA